MSPEEKALSFEINSGDHERIVKWSAKLEMSEKDLLVAIFERALENPQEIPPVPTEAEGQRIVATGEICPKESDKVRTAEAS